MDSHLPPATHYHRWPVRALNTLLRGLNSIGLAHTALDEDSLIAAARKECGLTEFGDKSFREPLRILVDSLENEAQLNPVGRILTRVSNVRLLRNRLMAQELLKKHPEILDRTLPPPVVVLGLGRSGTTRLHRLLASDPFFAHLKSWESVHPVPWPESYGAEKDPRITNIEQALKAVLYLCPQINAVHPLGAEEVEEELGLLQHGISSQIFEVMDNVPTFAEWIMTHDQTPAYEYMVVLMKIIGWFRNDPQDQPWVMKTPQHMQDLDALLNVFPDAKLICAHRDPIKVVGSLCSTSWNSLVRDTDYVDPAAIGDMWLDKVERMLHKTLALRETRVPADNQFDALYADISTDWESVMQRVYTFLELPLTPAAREGMEAWLAENRQHKHGAHKYRLEDFGLRPEQVDEKLMFYRQRFDIPYETGIRTN